MCLHPLHALCLMCVAITPACCCVCAFHLLCSTALHTTSIWSNTIGLQQDQAGTNSAIEASIYAPGGGGRGRQAKQQRAQELIEASKCLTASDWVAECQQHLNVM